MIQSFADETIADPFRDRNTKAARRIPKDLWLAVQRKLKMLDVAARADDLESPPGNRLKALQGDLKGRYSMRVNEQYRVTWLSSGAPIKTPFVSVPGLLTASCTTRENGTYFEVSVHGEPADPRTDDISGDYVSRGQLQLDWGLHLVDMNLTQGNLVGIVAEQARTFGAKK